MLFLVNLFFIIRFSVPFIGMTTVEESVVQADCSYQANESLRVFLANVETRNRLYRRLKKQIRSRRIDVVALVEPDKNWLSQLALEQTFPHSVAMPLSNDFGLALYSKFPFTVLEDGWGEDLPPTIRVVLDLNKTKVEMTVLHAFPPVSQKALLSNRVLFRRIATVSRHSAMNRVVLGDFNSTVYSKIFSKLLWGGGLHDVGRDTYVKTWNAHSWLKHLRIDHMLYKGCIRRKKFFRGQYFGSDHYPLIAEFEVGESQ